MTERERVLAAIRGEVPDRLPWLPRLEFWRRAKLRDGTLPAKLRSLDLVELAEKLGVGCYQVVPDFTDWERETDMADQALGLFRLPVLVYENTLEGVDRKVSRNGGETIVEYHTPIGSIRTRTVFTEQMLAAGASIPWTMEHAIQKPEDFEVIGYIFSHLRVEPRLEGYLARREQVGERGIVVAFLSGTACPMHHIMKELMPIDQFFFALHDYPEKVEKLVEQMEPCYQRMKEIALDSPAEVVLLGANYDDTITYPPFFEKHFVPPLRRYAEQLHRKGKYLMCHTDGENRKLFKHYEAAGFDIADSVCPYPMTSCTLEDFRDAFADRVTIVGGIPSVLLCPESTSEEEFRRQIDDLLRKYRGASRLILGVSDMVTADCRWDRLQYITDGIAQSTVADGPL